MQITVNGQSQTVDKGATVAQLLARLQLHPVRVAVEINEELVARKLYAQTPICNGDRVEIVTFVGGG